MARKGSTAVTEAMARVNSQMKAQVVTRASDERFKLKRIPSGILTIDRITGGGFVRGRHVELFGDYGACKSYTAYKTMVLAQQRGEIAAIIDSEHVFDDAWFTKLGGDPSNLIAVTPETAEEVVKLLMLFARGEGDLRNAHVVTIDSVASLLPKEELEKDPSEGNDRIASLARLMSRALRRVTTLNRDTVFIWTNQTREKIGSFIPGKTTPGGRALGFYATTRIEMVKDQKVKEKRKVPYKGKMVDREVAVGHWVQVRSEKEKAARPYMTGSFLFDTDNSCVDLAYEVLHLGMQDGLVEQATNSKGQPFYTYEDESGMEWGATIKGWRMYVDNGEDGVGGPIPELIEIISENSQIMAGDDGE